VVVTDKAAPYVIGTRMRINRDKIGANPEKLQMGMELRIPQE
jgi:hypothetical protein